MTWRIKLKNALRHQGVTYKDIADALNLSIGAVGHRLSGRTEPSLSEIRVMCDLAKMPITELVSDDHFLVADRKEIVLLTKLRELNPDSRALVERMLGMEPDPP